MNFQVPQFIEIEDKIFGPLTFKQFIFTVGGGGAAYVVYVYLSKIAGFLGILFALPVFVFALALAFYKINERPFIVTVEAAARYFVKSKLYRWKREVKKTNTTSQTQTARNASTTEIPHLSGSKLSDLSWSLDVKELTSEGDQ